MNAFYRTCKAQNSVGHASIIILLTVLLLGLNGCKTKEIAPVEPAEQPLPLPAPSWQLNGDITLENKFLLAAHANQKRLVVACTEGFFQLDAGDSSFVRAGGFGRMVPRLGTRGSANVGLSLYPPILSNNLYVSVQTDKKIVGLSYIGNTFQESDYYSDSGAGIYPDLFDPTKNLTIAAQDFRYNQPFGAFNEQVNTLLLHSSQGVLLVSRKDTSKVFSLLKPTGSNYQEMMNNNYRLIPIALPLTGTYKTSVRTSIAVGDHFIATPGESLLFNDVYLYAIYPDGTVKKVPTPSIVPSTYFFYKGKLYGYQQYDGLLVRSTDGGFTWQKLIKISFSSNVNFAEIDGRLIAYGQSQVLLLDDGTETFSTYHSETNKFDQLINTGLAGNKITGLASLGKMVYATTLSGLYQIKLADFFTKQPASD
ncbi:hypothetical protein [Spirosoma oryzicola]|uniref:hypothetical protein n=1 Tax=Spirosoma oryzicola TaxID=2898794 RepID=UPI001E3911B5|nr:hypothetical protein [Spirosoma oryzicola]UHG92678.1 hypothetical protein LQ777_07175 [Spirosoma oryzicola]